MKANLCTPRDYSSLVPSQALRPQTPNPSRQHYPLEKNTLTKTSSIKLGYGWPAPSTKAGQPAGSYIQPRIQFLSLTRNPSSTLRWSVHLRVGVGQGGPYGGTRKTWRLAGYGWPAPSTKAGQPAGSYIQPRMQFLSLTRNPSSTLRWSVHLRVGVGQGGPYGGTRKTWRLAGYGWPAPSTKAGQPAGSYIQSRIQFLSQTRNPSSTLRWFVHLRVGVYQEGRAAVPGRPGGWLASTGRHLPSRPASRLDHVVRPPKGRCGSRRPYGGTRKTWRLAGYGWPAPSTKAGQPAGSCIQHRIQFVSLTRNPSSTLRRSVHLRVGVGQGGRTAVPGRPEGWLVMAAQDAISIPDKKPIIDPQVVRPPEGRCGSRRPYGGTRKTWGPAFTPMSTTITSFRSRSGARTPQPQGVIAARTGGSQADWCEAI
ncbi:hypothetical protein FN846DRAFT_1025484 [Sphaerosporella brunnea]|uniref:Uncharacterized protein n=1 Tax=Sphaerosporella brunnea TaxID=1250544 RepID=A0A5J5EFB4_9PEZI|nr:hypothetical protein FN846DRAFT_1025484 [Sphaerosporella brunnea]